MSTSEPLQADLQAMFAYYEGPPVPLRKRRPAPRRGRRLALALAIAALVVGASVAGADSLDLFDGEPASAPLKAQIAKESGGAPAALDPGIDADGAVAMIRLAVPKGFAILYASPARNPDYSYCLGLGLSWLGGSPGLGCMGPVNGALPPIDLSIMAPGSVGTTPGYVFGRVNDPRAASLRLVLPGAATKAVALTHGYFLTVLDPGEYWPERADALAADGTVLSTYTVQQATLGLPKPS